MEIELKLLVNPRDIASFCSNPLLAVHATAGPRVQRLVTYFDTPDLYFRQRGAVLRVRKNGRRWIQTLKAGGQAVGGLHQRHEWESTISGPHPDFAAMRLLVDERAAGDGERALTDVKIAGQLQPIFITRIRRTVWELRLESGAEVELALDQGDVERGASRVPISEIELELKSGPPQSLFAFALEIEASTPVRVSDISKAERGFALLEPEERPAAKAAPLAFAAGATVEQGLQAIVANCLAQIHHNERGVVEGDDPSSVHQMRVGLRRLRAALQMFDEVAPGGRALQAELKWLNAELAPARDWEVLACTTLEAVETAHPEAPHMSLLRDAARRVAQDKRKHAAAAVRSRRYARLLLSIGYWLQTTRLSEALPPQQQVALAASLRATGSSRLGKLHRRLFRHDHDLQQATPDERHAVRKAARRLRYSAEFLASLYPAKQFSAFVAALIEAQDELGRMNDAAVAAELLGALSGADAGLAAGAAFINGYLACGADVASRKIGKRMKAIQRCELPRLD